MGEPLNVEVVIEQLRGYKRLVARIKYLEQLPIGYGMSVGSLYADDNLQALHAKLRGMPSYMYLNKKEQQLESVAFAYLTEYPTGTRSQLHEVRQHKGADAEDEKLLRELQRKIQKVIEARIGTAKGYEAVLERISELQDLEAEKQRIDFALDALAEYEPGYARLLRLRYIEEKTVGEAIEALGVVRKTFERWRPKAIQEYANIVGMS